MGEQVALAVHRVGLAGLADPDLGDHVPDELEVDLHDGDAGALAAARHGDGHVRLGLLPEVHRAVVGPPRLGLAKLRIARKIDLAAHDVHGQAGDPQLFLAGGVEIADLRDRQHLAEQPEKVEAPLVESGAGGDELGLGGPADLVLDLLDERLDLGRRPDGLLALDADQRGLVLLVREVQLDDPAGEQGAAHQHHDGDNVLPEQATARPHAVILPRGMHL